LLAPWRIQSHINEIKGIDDYKIGLAIGVEVGATGVKDPNSPAL
jgi:hypothetical protein